MKFDRYQRQFKFLHENRIGTAAELTMYSDAAQNEIDILTDKRKELYREKRRGDDDVSEEIAEITARLRALRRKMRMCGAIETDIQKIKEMSSMDGRVAHSGNRSMINEKTHKAGHDNPLSPYSVVSPRSGERN